MQVEQKRLSTKSKLSTSSNVGIKSQFLNCYIYKNTCQFAKKRNILCNNYCEDLQKQYVSMKIMSDYLISKIKINPKIQKDNTNFVQQFKIFITQFFGIINQVSTFQIQYLREVQIVEQQKLTNITQSMLQKLKVFQTSQKQFQDTKLTQKLITNQILTNLQSIKSDSKDPVHFYNYKHMSAKSKVIIESLQKRQKVSDQLRKDLDQIYQNSEQFQKQMVFYRQSFLNNKYKMLRKLTQLSKTGKSSITQLIVYLFDCVTKKVNDFQNKLKISSEGIIRSKHRSTSTQGDQNQKLNDYIINITQEYNLMNQELQQLLKYLSEALQGYSKRAKQNQSKKQIIELLNKVYEAEQFPNNQILDTLYLYNFFSMKIADMVTSIYSGYDNLIKLKNNVRKHSEITLALIRCNPYKEKTVLQKNNPKQKLDQNVQIQELIQQMSNDYPINIIEQVYKSFQQTLSYLKNYISTKYHKKKKHIQDSMQISHFEQTVIKPQKKPCKNQIWMWGKWQNQKDFCLQTESINPKQIKNYLLQFEQKIPEGMQKNNFICGLVNRKDQKGNLTVFDKYLKFEASNGTFTLFIDLKHIEDVQIAVKVFNKVLVVTTGVGQLIFSSIINFQDALQIIETVMGQVGNSQQKQARIAISLSPQQLSAIQQRKVKIKSQLPNLDQMKLIFEHTIQNFTIDNFFDLIYSDKPVKIKGKQQSCFMAYAMKRGGASNYETTKYDSIGPKFYTHQQGVNFINAPFYSSRTVNYDVKLPKIPFMNPYAHNNQNCKIFWISNEQFQYLNNNKTTGAPGTDCFYIDLVDRIAKVDKNLKIEVFFKIVWTSPSNWRSVVQPKAIQQVNNGVKRTLKEVCKYIQSHRGSSNSTGGQQMNKNEQKEQAQEEQQKQKSNLNGKISKLQNQNKYLLIGLGAILLFNIIFKLFFSN